MNRLSVVENLRHRELPTGHHVGAVYRVVPGEDAYVVRRAVDRDSAPGFAGVQDEDHKGPGFEPGERLLRNLRVGVVRGDYLDRQVGGAGPVAPHRADLFKALAAHEGGVWAVDGLGVRGAFKSRLGGVGPAEVVGLDVAPELSEYLSCQ